MKNKSHIKKKFALVCSFLFLICSQALAGQKIHTVFFEGEENELHVYRINGTKPGKTLLIIGGIQGDEPGGFLAADFYADFMLEKGNLIVVPRANFPSILKKGRKINQDMNRKFLDDNISNYEARVVNVLKKLICESDSFLNLHEGSGIYSDKWENKNKNPNRFGQSIITDDSILKRGDLGEDIYLEEMAQKVIEKINQHIENKDLFFHFNNHKTNHPDSIHKEQLRSATYYAYHICKIPAFGIESAKFLPLEQKVRQHIYAINAFMEILDIIPQTPGIDLEKPEMQYMIISVNDSIPVVVEKMQRLKINKGDTIQIHNIVANYERGLSVDVIGLGNQFNDMKKKLIINESTRIEAKKDFYKCGSVFLDIDSKSVRQLTVTDSSDTPTLRYKLRINGQLKIVNNYEHVKIHRGDKLVIEDILAGSVDPSKYIVNFKGFVGNHQNNSGEDRGYVIDTAKGVLMERYSLNKKGRHYYVLTTLRGKKVGKIFIDIQPYAS
ncbi:MAG: succinylglutamate desuccinylase/aspartoacylase family protein [Desulfobacula sp.]|uniref:M14/M99 family metallopeptidase n=1 Tax=Desulfobacula sp. TaxID=2593537 RepID=UPI0025C06B13|nr:M14/M99 family metallopeptidase [Desulfobacula sp.]MCD4720217.1 succinylglutamate desuccinylase/aspartoacylase family protein [Desulfobacula sp.]